MKTKPSKPRKVAKLRATLTRRAQSPFPEQVENIVKLRQWARRSPLHGVLSLSKLQDMAVFVLDLRIRGHGKHIASYRSSFTSLRFALTDPEAIKAMVRRQAEYARGHLLRRARRDLAQPLASLRDELPWAL